MSRMKGNAIAAMTILFVGIAIAVSLVANVVMTTVYSPLQSTSATYANSTALTNLNSTAYKSHQFYTSNVDNTLASSLVVAYQGISASTVNVTDVIGTAFCELDGTSPDTCTVPTTVTLTNGGITYLNYSSVNNNATNITSATLTYSQKGNYYGWDTGTKALWLVVGIAVVAALLLFVFGGRQ